MANPIAEPVYAGEFVLSEATRHRSRDVLTIAQSQTLKAGTVLGLSNTTAPTAAFSATGATGNPTSGAITVAAGTEVGEYDLVMTDATHFDVYQPPLAPSDVPGELVGKGVFGSAFSAGGLGFTLTAGGTPCIASDVLKITVSGGVSQYVAYNPSATDGSQIAAAICFAPVVTAASVTASAVGITRAAEVKGPMLDWGAASGPQITAGIAQLSALGIIVR